MNIFLGMNVVIRTPESIEFATVVNKYKIKGKCVYDAVSEKGSIHYEISPTKKINTTYICASLTKTLDAKLKLITINTSNYEKAE